MNKKTKKIQIAVSALLLTLALYLILACGRACAYDLPLDVSPNTAKSLLIITIPALTLEDLRDNTVINRLSRRSAIALMNTNSAKNHQQLKPDLLQEILTANNIPFLFSSDRAQSDVARQTNLDTPDNLDERAKLPNPTSPASPNDLASNHAASSVLSERAAEFLSARRSVVFLELAALAELEELSAEFSPESYSAARRRIIEETADLIEHLLSLCERSACGLLIVTPYPSPSQALSGHSLTPVIFFSAQSPPGLLSSASTKRKGLITTFDITSSLPGILGITAPADFSGAPVQIESSPDTLGQLFALEHTAVTNYRLRPVLLKGYVALQISIVLTTLALLLLKRRFLSFIRPLLLALTIFPLLFLVLPILRLESIVDTTIVLLSAAVLLAIFLEKTRDPLNRLALICLLTAAGVLADLLLGAPLMKTSLLGYCPISGARYYGLGNEYMGVLLGSSLIGSALLLEIIRDSKVLRFFIPAYAGLCFFVAAPQWGTNVGGAISFLSGFILLSLLFSPQKLRFRFLPVAALGILVFLIVLFCYDLSRPWSEQSHIGQTARQIEKGGLITLLPIILQKLAMNLKLFNYSSWSKILIIFLAASLFLYKHPPGVLQKVFKQYNFFKSGFISGIIASFVALFVNDSGIVAAATSMIYVFIPLLYLIIAQLESNA